MRNSLFLKGASVTIFAVTVLAAVVQSREARGLELTEPESKATVSTESILPSTETTTSASTEAEDETKVVLFTMLPTGFETRELTIPAGKYLVVVRNRTGLHDFTLRLGNERGETLREVRARRFARDWKQKFELSAGAFMVSETDHPDWNCRITVTAR